MKFQVVALLLLQCEGLLVNAAPSVEIAPGVTIEADIAFEKGDYSKLATAEMVWEGTIVEGEDKQIIHGTVEQVWGSLESNNVTLQKRDTPSSLYTRDGDVSKRTPISHHDCDGGLVPAFIHPLWSGNARPVEDAIRHLKNVGGTCGCPPRSCCRVSCSWRVGVHICNNNDVWVHPACRHLGEWFVQHLNNHCTRWAHVFPRDGMHQVCGGRVWANAGAGGPNWSVHLDEQNC